MEKLQDLIATIPDFPKAGIQFRDINPILSDAKAFRRLVNGLSILGMAWQGDATHIVGMDARGFILGAALALQWDKGFIPVRKAGKLPGKVANVAYSLEYGEAALEIQHSEPGKKIVIVDDILATGGTAKAAYQLCKEVGYTVLGGLFVLDVPVLRKTVDLPFAYDVLLWED